MSFLKKRSKENKSYSSQPVYNNQTYINICLGKGFTAQRGKRVSENRSDAEELKCRGKRLLSSRDLRFRNSVPKTKSNTKNTSTGTNNR